MTNRFGHGDEEPVGAGTVGERQIAKRDPKRDDDENREHDRGERLDISGGIGFAKHHLGDVTLVIHVPPALVVYRESNLTQLEIGERDPTRTSPATTTN